MNPKIRGVEGALLRFGYLDEACNPGVGKPCVLSILKPQHSKSLVVLWSKPPRIHLQEHKIICGLLYEGLDIMLAQLGRQSLEQEGLVIGSRCDGNVC